MPDAREYRGLTQAREALGGRLDRDAAPCLFDGIDWLQSLHRHCFARMPVRILRANEGDAELWLFLLSPQARRACALANWYSFSWNPIFLGNPDTALRQRLLRAAIGMLTPDVAMADMFPVTADDGTADELIRAFRGAGWFAVRRAFGGRYDLRLDGRDFATWWAQRPGPLRTLVRRRSRHPRLTVTITDRLTDRDWNDYVAVGARSWKEPETALPFLRALAQREADAGALRLGFARLDGVAVATQLWTIDHGVALIHKLAHDRAYDALSPGTLLSHAMFAHAIDVDRVDAIDYGTGDNGYKADWMDRRRTLYRIDAFNPRFASSWLPAARAAISALVG
ncbi:GNAT family N-acetyltransferase [Sphingobium sp. AN641]|uniref:GNAT family N-acetyltransferase n=1 Tax=Sphingobium sp. AN641 TaxID=3133443 RepID=UPI0030BAF002